MTPSLFDLPPGLASLARSRPEYLLVLADPTAGLLGLLAIDDTRLGPAAGGIRTQRYACFEDALEDALRLSRAMTIKCALAGLDAGGGKLVLIDHPGLDRQRAFAIIGQRIEKLGGLFRTAGDLGTRAEDLAAVARHTQFVHTDEAGLAAGVARGLLRAVEACCAIRDHRALEPGRPLTGLRVAVQGAGAIGAAAARALAGAGAEITIADLDAARAEAVARPIAARVVSPEAILFEPVDVIAPCAVGGVIDEAAVDKIRAWAISGAANNILAGPRTADLLSARGCLHVPDPIVSAGAVIDGIGRSVMGLADPTPLIDRLGETAYRVLEQALAEGRAPERVAAEIAERRLAGGDRRS